MRNSTSVIERYGARLGAIITEIDLTSEISDAEKESLHRALDEYQVIFFPEQNLTPVQQKEVTTILCLFYPRIHSLITWMMIRKLRSS